MSSTLPSTIEQARHALLLLGAPAPARLVVAVHAALFDGDLDMSGLAGLLRARTPGFCAALTPDLTPAAGLIALDEWPLDRRVVTPARQRADELGAIVRVAEFAGVRASAPRSADRLLRSLAQRVPDGVESLDLAQAARAALTALEPALTAESGLHEAAVRRAEALPADQQLYGVPAVPQQRGGA
ncbi:hypothetical protein HH310_06640 [Actinoplanes sp. TBRC 11911]|uniref:hypothetical protein n=1 Tax=Actinoplanes sp. TBRC 11911 TaxID=2729386 RepID=UPI00145C5E47|nr:hypothetical protein [Actinoplanes sp. TBRC 11911]NMO50870.1 hypothetical protein [Actinoplanes sp. TBRC 11911]